MIRPPLSCAVPVIGNRAGGLPEVVRDGETGFLVEVGEVAEAADRCLELQRAMVEDMTEKDISKRIKQLEKQMLEHARNLEFEKAARVRDQLAILKEQAFGAVVHDNVVPIDAGKKKG